jgi:crotonobetainyl-CoA hydratase
MSATEFCKVDREGPLTIITLNRPDVMNALHPPAHFELAEVFDTFASDPEQWVAIVTGAGERAFSAGNDLKYQASGGKMSAPPSGFGGIASRFDLDKPLIAAVNGIAMGGGFEIALACDIIVAAETAVFALPEPRVGLAALAGGLHRLPREIGTKRALGMILTGRRVSAPEGLSLGFVNDVVPPAELMTAARRWAKQILELSPMSIRASKQAVYRGLEEPSVKTALANQRNYPAVAAMFRSDDFTEGPRAFAEKRAPQWKGR